MKAALLAALMLLPAPAAAEAPAGRSTFRAAETVSDGAYAVLRRGVFGTLLPARLAGRMGRAPKGDSYDAFRARLARADWSGAAAEDKTGRVADAFVDTLVERYQLEAFGKAAGAYALDPANWEARFLASASVLGGAYLWAAGAGAEVDAGPATLGLRLSPGWRWRAAAEGGEGRLVAVSVSPRGTNVSFGAERGARPGSERATASWTARF